MGGWVDGGMGVKGGLMWMWLGEKIAGGIRNGRRRKGRGKRIKIGQAEHKIA